MAKDPQSEHGEPTRQVNFRCKQSFYKRLERVADVFNMDIANLARLILSKHLHKYEQEADDLLAEQRKKASGED